MDLLAYRSTVHETVELMPVRFVFEKEIRLPGDKILSLGSNDHIIIGSELEN